MKITDISSSHVALIAWNTLREALRARVHYFFLLTAVAFVVGAGWLRDFNFGASELKFLGDCGLGAMAFFGTALVISATAQLFFSELEHRTILTLLAKPVRRAEFVLGKFLGVTVLAAAFCALLALVLAAVLGWRERELVVKADEAISYGSLAAATLLQWLKLTVLAAFTLLVASYARTQLFTMVAAFFLWAIFHLQHLAHGAYARAGVGWERGAAVLLSWVFPNFQLFSLADSLAVADVPSWGQMGRIALYALAYVAAASGLAVVSFNRREL